MLDMLPSCKSSAVLQVSADSGCAQLERPAIALLCRAFRPCAEVSECNETPWCAAELLRLITTAFIISKMVKPLVADRYLAYVRPAGASGHNKGYPGTADNCADLG